MIKRKIQSIYHLFVNTDSGAEHYGQEASNIIKEELLKNKASMIARLGSTELRTMVHILKLKTNPYNIFRKALNFEVFNAIENASGFFPANHNMLEKFTELMIEDMQYVDILGSWRSEEKYFKNELSHTVKIRLKDIEPYYHQNPWTEILEDKKILIVHPFTESIISQYSKRKLLFKDPRILPNFELKTVKSVQSIAGNKPAFPSWFDALNLMKEQIVNQDFDIAIVGCGAYGFPLAAHIKRMGKKVVHMGGATQIWFGIFGKRWESNPIISSFKNEHWIHPSTNEIPKNFKKVEQGGYW